MPSETTSTSFIEISLVDEKYPSRIPLTAKYKKGFAYKTIGYRLPVILTKIIDKLSRDKNDIGEKYGQEARVEIKDIVGKIAKIKNEMITNKALTPVPSPVWNAYLSQVADAFFGGKTEEVKWYLSPWLYVECYMYQRIHDAFTATTHLKNYDYFKQQKDESFYESLEPASVLGEFLSTAKSNQETRETLLEVSLWGNRCDLSMSSGEQNSQQTHLLDHLTTLKSLVLCDDSAQFWKYLNEETQAQRSIGYVLDNAGFELFTDLCFADSLLGTVERVDFYVKTTPWFISDALTHDVHWIIEAMSGSDKVILNQLGEKWRGYLDSDRWRIVAEPFWTYPHSFSELKDAEPTLYTKLSTYTALIFKGDLNYRKLVGDISWEPETPFKEALQGFLPAPLLALRTCKADTVAGLKAGVAEEVSARSPDWMISGEFGLIQFAA